MIWTVKIMRRALKQVDRLPVNVRENLTDLIRDMELHGPVRGNWPNYSRLSENRHHCHIKKGQPTYVTIWEVTDKGIKLIEVTYAGTHEKAPY
ncbi:MAG: cytotoxic translational repressor of toxin-antitoxin stability system [Syntrophus sp. RIFOXYC2_FULL_54_9]|nr:MAG: cytotoxic translational repressor of toxin-antitoxin stability system [Syntrophus sp. RIFOXYC2_FULL_54_9]